jgi:hypothetical protein
MGLICGFTLAGGKNVSLDGIEEWRERIYSFSTAHRSRKGIFRDNTLLFLQGCFPVSQSKLDLQLRWRFTTMPL